MKPRNLSGTRPGPGGERRGWTVVRMEFSGTGTMVAAATDVGICMFEFADYIHLDRELHGLAATFGTPPIEMAGPLPESLDAPHGDTAPVAARDEQFRENGANSGSLRPFGPRNGEQCNGHYGYRMDPALSRDALDSIPGVAASRHLRNLRRQVEEYLRGERCGFDLPLDPVGTEFQRRVWRGLLDIPYGATISYAAQAGALGCPSAVRAVAGANGRNKISIIIPCHRVIGTDGSLTGYGGGVERKRFLLELERRTTSKTQTAR